MPEDKIQKLKELGYDSVEDLVDEKIALSKVQEQETLT